MFRPWIWLGTAIVVAAVAGMIALGFWQLRRLDERRAINAVRETIRTAPPVTLPAAPPVDRRLEHPARARGRFGGSEFTIINRSYKGAPGVDIVSTFELEGGERLLVDRGFVPLPSRNVAPAPPTGPVEIAGFLVVEGDDTREPHPNQLPPRDWVRVAPARMAAALAEGGVTAPAYLPYWLAATVNTGDGTFPIAKALPPMDDGPHLSYAIQWFSFATIFGVGWLFFLYRQRRGG